MEVGSATEHERERREFLAVERADFRLISGKVVEVSVRWQVIIQEKRQIGSQSC